MFVISDPIQPLSGKKANWNKYDYRLRQKSNDIRRTLGLSFILMNLKQILHFTMLIAM